MVTRNSPMATPHLKSTIPELRAPRITDAPAMQRHFANWNVVKHIGGIPWPYPKDGALSYIERRREDAHHQEIYFWGLFASQAPEELIGAIEYRFVKGDDENRGFWLSEAHWGKGLMTEAVRLSQDFVFFELGKTEVLVRNLVSNHRSRRVKEKTGGELIGTGRGEYHDGPRKEEIWRITRDRWIAARQFDGW